MLRLCRTAAALSVRPAPPMSHLAESAAVPAVQGAARCAMHATACARFSTCDDSAAEEKRRVIVNRLLYRSQQRGFLELDLLVGGWALDHLPTMSSDRLAEYAQVLDQENPDLFSWLTGQTQAPKALQTNSTFQDLQKHVLHAMESMPELVKAKKGIKWLRGWEDGGKGQETPPDEK